MNKFRQKEDHFFNLFSVKVAEIIGNAWSFILVTTITIIWIAIGFFCDFSENWKAITHIVPSIITLLIVFSIQNSQNRETKSIQIKLNELIRTHEPAKNHVMDLSTLSDTQLKELEQRYMDICSKEQNHNPNESK